MADTRKSELPLGDSPFDGIIWNAFFDDNVQSVLKARKEINLSAVKLPSKGTNSFLRAWPITAYKTIIGAAYWPHETEDSNFFYYWNWDEKFIAELFLAVTRYKTLPESEWDLRRALVECPRSGEAKTYYTSLHDLHRAAEGFDSLEKQRWFLGCAEECCNGGYSIKNSHRVQLGDIPPGGLAERRPFDFKEIAALIEENFPHLQTKLTRSTQKKDGRKRKMNGADYLRTKVFYEERRDRLRILKEWEPNLTAFEQWRYKLEHSDFDYSSLSHRPHPSYFKNLSVTKKSRKQ